MRSQYGVEYLRHMRQHQHGVELLEVIRSHVNNGDEVEADVAAACYWFANHWHGGQWCPLYASQCQNPFSPGPCSDGPEPDSCEQMIYEDLCSVMEAR